MLHAPASGSKALGIVRLSEEGEINGLDVIGCGSSVRHLGSGTMPTYVMLSTIGPDGWATIREKPARIRGVTDEVEAMGLKVIAQYAVMGQYDFVNIIEAPDEATMARAAVMLAARGTMRSTTMQALTVDELVAALEGGEAP